MQFRRWVSRTGSCTVPVIADRDVERILVIVAHPDDAEFWTGGTVAGWTDAGVEVIYCVLTVPRVLAWPFTLRWYLSMRARRGLADAWSARRAVGYGDDRAVAGGAGSPIRCRLAAVAAALAVPGGLIGPLAAWFAVGQPVQLWAGYPEVMSELPVDGMPGVAVPPAMPRAGRWPSSPSAGRRWAAIVPAEFAEALEGMSWEDARELLEDLADAAAARQALAEPGESIPWEQVRAEAGL